MKSTFFPNVWYRSAPRWGRHFTLVSFQDRGALLLAGGEIAFIGRRKIVKIPVESIDHLGYVRLRGDWVNKWVKIAYDGGSAAYFTDGSLLGWRGILGGSRRILETVSKYL
jgi:hypothetical protein